MRRSPISKTKLLGHLLQCLFQLKLWIVPRPLSMWSIRWTLEASSLSMLSLKMAPMPSMSSARSKVYPRGRRGNSSFSMMEQTSASSSLTRMEATCLCTMMTLSRQTWRRTSSWEPSTTTRSSSHSLSWHTMESTTWAERRLTCSSSWFSHPNQMLLECPSLSGATLDIIHKVYILSQR